LDNGRRGANGRHYANRKACEVVAARLRLFNFM
jgi:hypothetical protein